MVGATDTPAGPQAFAWTNADGSWNGATAEADYDEVRVWNYARTPEQLAAAFAAPLTGPQPGLVGYWNFDGLNGNDSSGLGNGGIPTAIVQFMLPPRDPAPVAAAYPGQTTFVEPRRRLGEAAGLLTVCPVDDRPV